MKLVAALLLTVTAVLGAMAPLPPLTLGVTVQVLIATEHAVAAVLLPVALPLQPHVHGPVPDTAVAVPVLHKLADGATNAGAAPLAEPQAPLIGVRANDAITLQLAVTAPVV